MAISTTLEAAHEYRDRGWSVIPLLPRGKTPALESWKPYQTRRATDEELQAWFGSGTNNIGVVTGKISNLTVVDADSAEAVAHFERACCTHGESCWTYTVKTARGKHWYFQWLPGSSNFQQRADWPGVDLRSEGGYVVAPPSVHPSGMVYAVDGDSALDPAACPSWMWLPLPRNSRTVAHNDDIFAPAMVGQRNMQLTRLAGILARDLPLGNVLPICRLWNRQNTPPLPDEEVRRTVESIGRAEARNHPAPPPLIVEPEAFREAVLRLRTVGLPKGASTGWPTVDEYYRVPLGQWTLITGIPGHGKSSLMSHLMVNLMENEGWKFVVFSAENLPLELFLARLLAIYLKKPFHSGPTLRLSEEEVAFGVSFFQAHLRFINVVEGTTLPDIVAEAERLMVEWPFQGLTIDPWNELPHGDGKKKETDVVSEELTVLRRFARQQGVHCWVVAHPAKMQKHRETGEYGVPTPYDVSGSAHFRNKADFCLCVHRDPTDNGPATLFVQKVRFREHGLVGSVELEFDPIVGRYHDIN